MMSSFAEGVQCCDCEFYTQITPLRKYKMVCGRCRRFPPTAMTTNITGQDDLAQYPMIPETNPVCGEFVLK